MSIVLFAIIGVQLHLGAGYWICFSIFCALKLIQAIQEAKNDS